MTETEQILIGLIVVGLGLTLKVLKDGLKEIEKYRGMIAYTVEETARYNAERVEAEAEGDQIRAKVDGLKQEVTSLEQRTSTMRTVVAGKKAAIEKEKQAAQTRAGF